MNTQDQFDFDMTKTSVLEIEAQARAMRAEAIRDMSAAIRRWVSARLSGNPARGAQHS